MVPRLLGGHGLDGFFPPVLSARQADRGFINAPRSGLLCSGAEGLSGCGPVGVPVGGREVPLVQKAPAHRDAGHGVAPRWVGVEQVDVGSIKPHEAHIAEWVVSRWRRNAYCSARGVMEAARAMSSRERSSPAWVSM